MYKKLGTFLKLIKAVLVYILSETDADKNGKIVLPFPAIFHYFLSLVIKISLSHS
jgi:hypothetical protein